MKIIVKLEGGVPTLKVTENKVTCTLTLGKLEEIVTKGNDINGISKKLAYSHRVCFGQNASGIDYLNLIKKDMLEREGRLRD